MNANLNELFLQWLQEWHHEAISHNSKSRFSLRKAIDSLSKCQVTLRNAQEAVKLPGIGNGIVKRLEERLESTLQIHSSQASSFSSSQQQQPSTNSFATPKKEKRPRKEKVYIPNYRSGAYAILAALYSKGGIPLGKAEIQQVGQEYCDSSFTVPHSLFKYTAWNSMKTLIEKKLVCKQSNNSYELTDLGRALGEKLGFSQPESSFSCTSLEPLEQKYLAPGSFDIICFVDGRERFDSGNRDVFSAAFRRENLSVSTLTLEVGDFLWVAKCKTTGTEIVLDVIVERKRHDDFIASISTSRFKEQRNRLSKCRIPKVIYLLEACRNCSAWEDFGMDKICNIIAELEMNFNFTVHHTQNIEESIYFLQCIHRALQEQYSTKGIHWSEGEHLTFVEFQSLASKSANLTVNDVFVRQLCTLKMVSVEKALAIVKHFPTIRHLYQAYEECANENEKKMLLHHRVLSSQEEGEESKPIGKKLSEFIWEVFSYE